MLHILCNDSGCLLTSLVLPASAAETEAEHPRWLAAGASPRTAASKEYHCLSAWRGPAREDTEFPHPGVIYRNIAHLPIMEQPHHVDEFSADSWRFGFYFSFPQSNGSSSLLIEEGKDLIKHREQLRQKGEEGDGNECLPHDLQSRHCPCSSITANSFSHGWSMAQLI